MGTIKEKNQSKLVLNNTEIKLTPKQKSQLSTIRKAQEIMEKAQKIEKVPYPDRK